MNGSRYEVRGNDEDGFHFVLIASNGEVVETSEQYTRRDDAERGVEAAQRAAAAAESGSDPDAR